MSKELIEKFVSIEQHELVFSALKKGRGIFFISGHISNWEISAFAYAKIFRTKINVIAKPQSNRFVNEKLTEYRELCGNEIIEIGVSLRTIFKKILQNEIVAFLMDQSAHPDYSVYAEFFGQKVATFAGPAKMALKFKTELIFSYCQRNENFKYHIYIDKINYDDINEFTDENVAILTQRINKKLENVIRENPSQWLWFHRRFKHIKN